MTVKDAWLMLDQPQRERPATTARQSKSRPADTDLLEFEPVSSQSLSSQSLLSQSLLSGGVSQDFSSPPVIKRPPPPHVPRRDSFSSCSNASQERGDPWASPGTAVPSAQLNTSIVYTDVQNMTRDVQQMKQDLAEVSV